jgi:hypothetical protein
VEFLDSPSSPPFFFAPFLSPFFSFFSAFVQNRLIRH